MTRPGPSFSPLILLSFITPLLFSPTAQAVAYAAPNLYTIETLSINPINATLATVFTIQTWRLSADDPDQINGSLDYYLLRYNTTTFTSSWVDSNYQPVNNRPGYVHNISSENIYTPDSFNMRSVSVFQPSIGLNPSCQIIHDFSSIGFPYGQRKCGDVIQGVPGLGIRTIQQSNASQPLLVGVTVTLSPDDNGTAQDVANNGSTYLRKYGIWMNDPNSTTIGLLQNQLIITATGPRQFESTIQVGTPPPGGVIPVRVMVFSNDSLLHEQASQACILIGNVGLQAQGTFCGNVTGFNGASIPGIPTNPTSPFVDLHGSAMAMGLTDALTGYLFAVLLIITFSIMGYMSANIVGLSIGGGFGIILSTLFGMLPLWLLVFLVLIALTLVVRKFSMGGSTQ